MNFFDKLVEQALQNNMQLSVLRPVVEKEILHHDILREMSAAGFLKELTFIGGTCLRNCYGSHRLSEDLDFSGGFAFDRKNLKDMGRLLKDRIYQKYGFYVEVSEPVKDQSNTDTWKLKIIVRPERADLTAQRINIDICRLESYDRQPVIMRNHYGIDMGTSGLILYAESMEEILADKIVALALRLNRFKYRDIWDIVWLHSQNITINKEFIRQKLNDRNVKYEIFSDNMQNRYELLKESHDDFLFEMKRFLPVRDFEDTLNKKDFWVYVLSLINNFQKNIL